MTYAEIGRILGISGAFARVIEQRALRKLSHPKNREQWESIMETMKMMDETREKEGGIVEARRPLN